MRLLKLDSRVQQMVIDDMITTGHARALLSIPEMEKQYEFAQRIFDEKLSVRDVEKEVKRMLSDKVKPALEKKLLDPQLEAIYSDMEEKLKAIFGTKVSINAKDNEKGKLEIEYYSQDALNEILEKMQTIS